MPTQDQVRQMVAEFEHEYPESLSDRLKWWARVLGIDRIRLFRLLGLSGAEAARTPLAALPQVVASHEDLAEMVDEMLGQLLASFDYDLPAFRTAAHCPVGPASTERAPGHAPARCRRSAPLHPSSAGAEWNPAQRDRCRRAVRLARTVSVHPRGKDRRRPSGKSDRLTPVPTRRDDRCSTRLRPGPCFIGSPGAIRSLPASFPGWGPTTSPLNMQEWPIFRGFLQSGSVFRSSRPRFFSKSPCF